MYAGPRVLVRRGRRGRLPGWLLAIYLGGGRLGICTYSLNALVVQEDGVVGLRERVSGGVVVAAHELRTGIAKEEEGRSVFLLVMVPYATSASLGKNGTWASSTHLSNMKSDSLQGRRQTGLADDAAATAASKDI